MQPRSLWNRGAPWDKVRFPRPLLHGDTVHVESEVLSLRPSRSRPKQGIVVFEHRAGNQRNEVVATCEWSASMLTRDQDSLKGGD